MATKNAHWQAAFRRRMREAGLKAMTVWLPKEGAVRLARYPERERGEVITRALVLLESRDKLTGNDATITDKLTGEYGGEDEDTFNIRVQKACAQAIAELSTRLERVEATLSAITSNPADEATIPTGYFTRELADNEPPGPPATPIGEPPRELTGEAANEPVPPTGQSTDKSRGEGAVALPETPHPPVSESPAGLPLKRIPALTRRAKKLHTQGVSWREIAHRFNVENVPTLSGVGQWYGSTVQHMIEKLGTSLSRGSPRDKHGRE